MPKKTKRLLRPEDIYLLKAVSDPQLSPDGKKVAYVVSSNNGEADTVESSVYVAPVDGSSPPRRFTYGKRDHSPRWSPDGRYLAFVSNRGKKNQIFLAPLDGGEARQATKAKFGAGQPAWSPDGRKIAYVTRVGEYKEFKERSAIEKASPRIIKNLRYKLDGIGFFDARRPHIFSLDVEGGHEMQLTSGDWDDSQPSWSPDGRRIVFVSDRERKRNQRHWYTDVWIISSKGGRARKLTRSRGGASYPTFSPDGRLVAFVGHEQGEGGPASNNQLYVVPPSGNRAPRSLSEFLDRPVAGFPLANGKILAWSQNGKSIFFLAADKGAVSIYRADVEGKSVSKVLGGERQIESFALAPKGKRIVFAAIWLSTPGEIYSTTLDGRNREKTLSRANDELLKSVKFGRLGRIEYASVDGLKVEGFALYPPDYRRGKSYPLVLDIHGGPHGMHPALFRSIAPAQSLAAAGYVVFLPNPRGSSSYGEEFMRACVGDWGGKDFADLMVGVDELIRRGIADPNRLYVNGFSYGGFMSSWTVGHTNRFQAAVVGAPVANQLSKIGTGDIPLVNSYEMGCTIFEKPERYWDRSPVSYLKNVKTPVLLLHWEGDLRCPIGQSEEIFQGLKLLGKKAEFVRYPGGSHMMQSPSQQVDKAKRIINWYSDHTPKRAR
jgi:dipeptidyl aminopeptidase/acylaminoacyl peptidase